MKIEFDDTTDEIHCQREISGNLNDNEIKDINQEIKELINKKVIEESIHEENEHISGIFTREKADGSHRMILNLKRFNKNV